MKFKDYIKEVSCYLGKNVRILTVYDVLKNKKYITDLLESKIGNVDIHIKKEKSNKGKTKDYIYVNNRRFESISKFNLWFNETI